MTQSEITDKLARIRTYLAQELQHDVAKDRQFKAHPVTAMLKWASREDAMQLVDTAFQWAMYWDYNLLSPESWEVLRVTWPDQPARCGGWRAESTRRTA